VTLFEREIELPNCLSQPLAVSLILGPGRH
jgi:hypothetical protein